MNSQQWTTSRPTTPGQFVVRQYKQYFLVEVAYLENRLMAWWENEEPDWVDEVDDALWLRVPEPPVEG